MINWLFKNKVPKAYPKDDIHSDTMCSKADTHIADWITDIKKIELFRDPLRCPTAWLDELGALLEAGVVNSDNERQIRQKVENAIEGHKKRGLWEEDVKVRIDAITGYSSEIYSNKLDINDWILLGAADDPNPIDVPWSILGGDNIDPYSMVLTGEGNEGWLDGIILIDLGNDSIPAATITKIVQELETNLIPAYYLIRLGYVVRDWEQLTPAGGPPPIRDNYGMAEYDGKLYIFGGDDGSFRNDLWEYDIDSDTYTNLAPSGPPSARRNCFMVSSGDGNLYMYGGNDGAYNSETWKYNIALNTWTNLSPGSPPTAREAHRMAYVDGNIYMFGGYNGSPLGDTWVYNILNNTWTNLNPATAPAARFVHGMQTQGGKVYLYGGLIATGQNDTWVYDIDANNWTNLNPTANPTTGRYYFAMSSYDHDLYIFGGYAPTGTDQIWKYSISGNRWQQLTPTTTPGNRYRLSMSQSGGDLYIFGGRDTVGTFYNDLWKLSASGLFVSYSGGDI